MLRMMARHEMIHVKINFNFLKYPFRGQSHKGGLKDA
jgi:hypothetical protein